MKQERLALLTDLVNKGKISSQTDAVLELKRRGIEATQTTVSRDLQEIGAVKRSKGGMTIYELAATSSRNDTSASGGSTYGAPLSRVLREFVIRRVASGQIVVLQTPPGHASVVAAALDRSAINGIMGVIAGDDTVFIACDADIGAEAILVGLDASA